MKANIGDWLFVNSRSDSTRARRAKILDVGRGGEPPYTVRWADTDHEAIIFPGPDSEIVTTARLEELDRVRAQRAADLQAAIRAEQGKRR
jgi:hypothetical protein